VPIKNVKEVVASHAYVKGIIRTSNQTLNIVILRNNPSSSAKPFISRFEASTPLEFFKIERLHVFEERESGMIPM